MSKSKITTCKIAIHDLGENLRIYLIGNVDRDEYEAQLQDDDGPIVVFAEFPCLVSAINQINARKKPRNFEETWGVLYKLAKRHWLLVQILSEALDSIHNEIIIWPNLKT